MRRIQAWHLAYGEGILVVPGAIGSVEPAVETVRTSNHDVIATVCTGALALGDKLPDRWTTHWEDLRPGGINARVVDADGVYRKVGPARVFTSERAAVAAIKGQGGAAIQPGEVMVLIGRGPLGCGMEETYQITSALRYLPFGKQVALITDARFSGVSTGAPSVRWSDRAWSSLPATGGSGSSPAPFMKVTFRYLAKQWKVRNQPCPSTPYHGEFQRMALATSGTSSTTSASTSAPTSAFHPGMASR